MSLRHSCIFRYIKHLFKSQMRYNGIHYNTVLEGFDLINPYFIKRNFPKDYYINLRNSDPMLPLRKWTFGYIDLIKDKQHQSTTFRSKLNDMHDYQSKPKF